MTIDPSGKITLTKPELAFLVRQALVYWELQKSCVPGKGQKFITSEMDFADALVRTAIEKGRVHTLNFLGEEGPYEFTEDM